MSINVEPLEQFKEADYKHKKFIEYLSEANHGIYNKDPRFKNIIEKMVSSIRAEFKNLKTEFKNITGTIEIGIETQPPAKKDFIELMLIWDIIKDDSEPEYRDKFFKLGSAIYNPVKEKANIGIVLVKSELQTKFDFYKEVKNFIENDINAVLYHEVKHILDRIDKRNTSTKIPKKSELSYETGKYQSQDKEIYNFLLTLIGEFESIERKNPDISFSSAIKKSKWYPKILDPMTNDKRNKLKGKLVDFWIDNYGLERLS